MHMGFSQVETILIDTARMKASCKQKDTPQFQLSKSKSQDFGISFYDESFLGGWTDPKNSFDLLLIFLALYSDNRINAVDG